MPIIASRASAAYGAGFAAITAPPYLGPFGAYDSIASIRVPSAGVAVVSFAGIPSGYKHLQLRMSTRTDFASASPIDMYLKLNGDDAYTTYRQHRLRSDGASLLSGTSASYDIHKITPAASSTASAFSTIILDLLDYSSTNKNKTVRYLGGADLNGSGHLTLGSILYPFTPAISSIILSADGSFVSGSIMSLYGIK